MARAKSDPSATMSCRVSPTLKKRCEMMVESGEYHSLTDLVEFALHYYLIKDVIISEFLSSLEPILDKKMKERLYSEENEQFPNCWLKFHEN